MTARAFGKAAPLPLHASERLKESGVHLEAKKEERQEMPAAWPSCALTNKFVGLFVPSTSMGPVGHCKKKTIPDKA